MYYYLASPYSSGNDWSLTYNYYAACMAQANILKKGITCISPIAAQHVGAFQHDLPKTYPFWKEHSRKLLQSASGLVILAIEGWDRSTGVKDELAYWRDLHPDWSNTATIMFTDLQGNLTPYHNEK